MAFAKILLAFCHITGYTMHIEGTNETPIRQTAYPHEPEKSPFIPNPADRTEVRNRFEWYAEKDTASLPDRRPDSIPAVPF